MKGLFAVIFLIIGIVNALNKQQNKGTGRDGRGRWQGQYRQKPVQKPKNVLRQPERTFTDIGRSLVDIGRRFDEISGNVKEYVPAPVFAKIDEGIEAEDRSRTGSLDYVEESRSDEGICDEHTHPSQQPSGIEITLREGVKLEFTEENLLQSVIMAEILGPPRAMKRNIR